MRSFLLSALALFNLFGGAFVEGYELVPVPEMNKVTSYDKNTIAFQTAVNITEGSKLPIVEILAGADCNSSAPSKNPSSLSISIVSNTTRVFSYGINDLSASPSLVNADGLPSFCVHFKYAGKVAINGADEIISELFVSYNFTKIVNGGAANFTLVSNITRVNTTEFKGEDVTNVGLIVGKAWDDQSCGSPPCIPGKLLMGQKFRFCAKADLDSFKVTTFKNVTCNNDGTTRQLALANSTQTTFDPLTSVWAGGIPKALMEGTIVSVTANFQCLESIVTAGFFSGSDTTFNCSGTAVTAPIGRRLDAIEGRSLQSIEEASFATTFELNTVEYDTLTASASVAGAGLSIASVLLALII